MAWLLWESLKIQGQDLLCPCSSQTPPHRQWHSSMLGSGDDVFVDISVASLTSNTLQFHQFHEVPVYSVLDATDAAVPAFTGSFCRVFAATQGVFYGLSVSSWELLMKCWALSRQVMLTPSRTLFSTWQSLEGNMTGSDEGVYRMACRTIHCMSVFYFLPHSHMSCLDLLSNKSNN